MKSSCLNNNREWKDVVGYEGAYQVSNDGVVRSLDRKNNLGKKLKGKIIKPGTGKNGYFHVGLCLNGIMSTHSVHRLIAIAFLGGASNDKVVNNIDGNKKNNHAVNLEWVTKKENMKHAVDSGLWTAPVKGNTHPSFKGSTIAIHLETGERLVMDGAAAIKANGFTRQNVYACLNGQIKQHKGYVFYREEVQRETI